HVDVPPEQPAIAVPRGGDGRVIVGFRRGDDPRMTARAEPADAPEHRARRREISEDHLERAPALDVAPDAPPPAVAHAERTRELPLQRSAPLAIFADQPPDRAELGALAERPTEQRIEVAAGRLRLGPFDPQPQVAPVRRAAVAQIGV